MKRLSFPNMRILTSAKSKEIILNNGGCTSYEGCAPDTIWTIGKAHQLDRLVELAGVVTYGKMELVPVKTSRLDVESSDYLPTPDQLDHGISIFN